MGQIRVAGEDVLLEELCGDVLVERDERLVILKRNPERHDLLPASMQCRGVLHQ